MGKVRLTEVNEELCRHAWSNGCRKNRPPFTCYSSVDRVRGGWLGKGWNWEDAKRDWLRQYIPPKNGIHPHDTIGRLFAAMNERRFISVASNRIGSAIRALIGALKTNCIGAWTFRLKKTPVEFGLVTPLKISTSSEKSPWISCSKTPQWSAVFRRSALHCASW